MNLFFKFFIFSFALFSTWSIKSEIIEVILHDNQIKQFLISKGLDLDKAWKNCFDQPGYMLDNSDLDVNELLSTVKKLAQKDTLNLNINFPTTTEKFETILEELGFIVNGREDDNNQTNIEIFNTMLKDENNRFEHIIKDLTISNLRNGINNAIGSYFHQRALSNRIIQDEATTKKFLHLYIKFVIDTGNQTITLQTCPYRAQTDFVKIYTSLLKNTSENVQESACNKVCRFVKGLAVAGAGMFILITVIGIMIDPESMEELVKTLEGH